MQLLAAIREGARIFKSGRAAFLNGNQVFSPDAIGNLGRKKLVVGFAAETENLVPNATTKLARKKCDLIVANDVGAEQAIFGGDLNRVVIVDAKEAIAWPQASKAEIASKIAALVAARLGKPA